MSRDVQNGQDAETTSIEPIGVQTLQPIGAVEGSLTLRDGVAVFVRPIRPDDAARLTAFHAGLSRETIVQRFFRRTPPLSPAQAAQLACVDYADRMALVATCGPAPGAPNAPIVAVARYDRTGDDQAEVGFVVADEWQGRGLGSALFHRLAAYARARGIQTFAALTMTSNTRVLGLLRRSGYPCTAHVASVEVELWLDISAGPVTR